MVLLLGLGALDFLLPAVQIPLFAWLMMGMFFIAQKAVKEAKKDSAPTTASAPPMTWIQSDEHSDTYATPDDLWAIVAGPKGEFWLWGEADQHVNLSHASGLGEAFSLAEVVIDATTDRKGSA